MRTYYDGPDALVTGQYFVWRTEPVRAFLIGDLRQIHLVQRGMGGSRIVLVAAAAAALALVAGPGWLLADSTAGRIVVLGAAGAAVTLAPLTRRSMLRWEVRAVYQGRDVIVYTCPEARTFNQVTRALRRAVEQSGPRHHDVTVAAA